MLLMPSSLGLLFFLNSHSTLFFFLYLIYSIFFFPFLVSKSFVSFGPIILIFISFYYYLHIRYYYPTTLTYTTFLNLYSTMKTSFILALAAGLAEVEATVS